MSGKGSLDSREAVKKAPAKELLFFPENRRAGSDASAKDEQYAFTAFANPQRVAREPRVNRKIQPWLAMFCLEK